MSGTAAKTCPLLNLPPEIWSKICKLAVTYDEPIMLFAERKRGRNTAESIWFPRSEYSRQRDMLARKQPPITRVCRKIREECLAHYYSTNTFCGYSFPGACEKVPTWLQTLGENKFALQSIFYAPGLDGSTYSWQPLSNGDFKLKISEADPEEVDDLFDLVERGFGYEQRDGPWPPETETICRVVIERI